MSDSNPPDLTLDELINAACCESLTPEQTVLLEQQLLASEQARHDYFQACEMTVDIWVALGAARAARQAIDKVEQSLEQNRRQADSPPLNLLSGAARLLPGGDMVVGGLVILAVTAAIGGLAYYLQVGRWHNLARQEEGERLVSKPGAHVGSLAAGNQARWDAKSSAPKDGVVRATQRYELASGTTKIVLDSGTQIVVEGPAIWQFASDRRLQLDLGHITARVPKPAVGFAVVTPSLEIVDLGTEFQVTVTAERETDLQVITGRVEVRTGGETPSHLESVQTVGAGQAVRASLGNNKLEAIPFDAARSNAARVALDDFAADAGRGDQPFPKDQPIWLGNLFDDRPRTSLVKAMRTDAYGAVGDFQDLGVDRVVQGGEGLQEIAPDIRCDLTNLGWQALATLHVANDALDEPTGFFAPLRTKGESSVGLRPRTEKGIGACANALITFHLDDIRAAGQLNGSSLEFICDRAGINDTAAGSDAPSVHMAVLVSTAADVRTAWVDGQPAQLAKQGNRWIVASPLGKPLVGDGRFVSFRVPIDLDDKYLTLISTSAGDNSAADHSVWSGARLEVRP